MNKTSNIFRILTFVPGFGGIIFSVYKGLTLIGIEYPPYTYIEGTIRDPWSWFATALLIGFFFLILPLIIPYETKLVKPKTVRYHKFPTHVAVVINDERIFTYKETNPIYHILGQFKSEERLSYRYKYNLYWCEVESPDLVINPVEKCLPPLKKVGC